MGQAARTRAGSERTNGVIEATVVENELSVLVSIEPLGGLKALVDMGAPCVRMKQVGVAIPTQELALPSTPSSSIQNGGAPRKVFKGDNIVEFCVLRGSDGEGGSAWRLRLYGLRRSALIHGRAQRGTAAMSKWGFWFATAPTPEMRGG